MRLFVGLRLHHTPTNIKEMLLQILVFALKLKSVARNASHLLFTVYHTPYPSAVNLFCFAHSNNNENLPVMMKTLTLLPSPSLSANRPPRSSDSTSSSSSMDSHTRRSFSHMHVDAFRAPTAASPHYRPESSPDTSEIQVSPRTLPLSFSVHEGDMDPTSTLGHPMLTIRKSRDFSGQHIPCGGSPPRRHRRQPSTEFSLSSVPREEGLDFIPRHHRFDEPGSEDEICPRHHHRQSVTSTVSITCSEGEEEVDDLPSHLERFEGPIESSIAMEPMAPTMLVPLVDRCAEMKELLEHPANREWTKLVQNTIGVEDYEKKCLPLWTETSREVMPDLEWLMRSKAVLSKKGCGGICDGRLWIEFCGMVGWDAGAPLEEIDALRRRQSRESLVSTGSSGKMSSIAEEEEFAGESRGLHRHSAGSYVAAFEDCAP